MSYTPSVALTAAGTRYCYIAFKDTEARYITGRSRTAPSAGAIGSGCFRLWGIAEANIVTTEPEVVPAMGDDTTIARFVFDAASPMNFNAVMAVYDLEMAAAFLGTTVVTRGGGNMLVRAMEQTPSYSAVAVFNGQAMSYPNGAAQWYTDLVPNVTVKVLGRTAMTMKTAATFNVNITANPSPYDLSGISLTTAVNGTEKATIINFSSPFPVTYSRHTGTGVVTAFQVDEKPAGSAFVFGTSNGVPLTVASVNNTVLPFTVTYTVAPASGAVVVTQYGFDPAGLA